MLCFMWHSNSVKEYISVEVQDEFVMCKSFCKKERKIRILKKIYSVVQVIL